jgi:hypothetical protein
MILSSENKLPSRYDRYRKLHQETYQMLGKAKDLTEEDHFLGQ